MRTHSIKTTYLIHKTLSSNEDLLKLIDDDNMFLVVAEPEAVYPYIVITRQSIRSSRHTKDFTPDVVLFNIKVYAESYNTDVDIADTIRFILEGNVLSDSTIGIRLTNIELTSITENWVGDSYLQSMDFQAEVETA